MSLTARIDAARHQATLFFRRHRNIQSAAIAAGGFVAVVYFLGAVTDFVAFEFRKSAAVEEPISQLIQALEAPAEAEAGTTAEIDNRWLFLTQPGGRERAARVPDGAADLVSDLYARAAVPLADRGMRASPEVVITTVLTVVFLVFIGRHMMATMAIGRSVGEVVRTEEIGTRFDDVAGAAEAKRDLQEIVGMIAGEVCYRDVGAHTPAGVLFHGPPGTGKTLLARATAGEAHVNFIAVTGSDLGGIMVGRGAQDVAGLFARARRMAPCILFIDEIDAVGKARGPRSHADLETTLNKLLSELDGMKDRAGVFVMAATNHVADLDPALVRPGRFDRVIHVPLPDRQAREALLGLHAREMPLDQGASLADVAVQTAGMSGADLRNLCNEAAVQAGRSKRVTVTAEDFDAALMKIRMGEATGGVPLLEDERRRLACHEAGHAVVALLEKSGVRLHRVTIEPRGMRLGHVLAVPEHELKILSRRQIEARLRMLAAGRAGEMVSLGEDGVSSLAEDDIAQASQLAWEMVSKLGMTDGKPFFALPSDVAPMPQLGQLEDASRLTAQALEDAAALLAEHAALHQAIAEALLDVETIDEEALARIAISVGGPPVGSPAPAATACVTAHQHL
jgi:cell division protease FtsH